LRFFLTKAGFVAQDHFPRYFFFFAVLILFSFLLRHMSKSSSAVLVPASDKIIRFCFCRRMALNPLLLDLRASAFQKRGPGAIVLVRRRHFVPRLHFSLGLSFPFFLTDAWT